MKLISKIKVSNFQIFILENENILYISIGTLDSDIDRYKKDNKIVLNSESERTQIDSATTSKPVFVAPEVPFAEGLPAPPPPAPPAPAEDPVF